MKSKAFTGWHMTGILVAFFGVVITVNLVMARLALGSFGGTVVENSYVASQKFNGWLDQADAQKALGWTVVTDLGPDRHIHVRADHKGAALRGAEVIARVRHPLGRAAEQEFRFVADQGGWRSVAPLPAGRWLVHIDVRRGSARYQSLENLQ